MTRTAVLFLLTLAALGADGRSLMAQSGGPDVARLRADVERRFDILPLRDGIALRPKDPARGIRSIEVTAGPIAIDGAPVSGAELRNRLGRDADLVLQLSYLNEEERRSLFDTTPGASLPSAPTLPPAVPSSPAPPPPPAADDPAPSRDADNQPETPRRRNRSRDDDLVGIGFSGVTVREGQTVDGDVVAVGGAARIYGEVRGDVVGVGGGVRLGPRAVVGSNVVVIGGRLERDPAAIINGQVQEIGLGNLDFGRWRWPVSAADRSRTYWGTMFGSTLALFGTLTRLAILCLLAALVILVGHRYADVAGERASLEPLKSGATGLLTQVLFIPILVIAILVLLITIIGIPLLLLLPFLILGFFVAGLVGFTGVAQRLGQAFGTRVGWATTNPYAMASLGMALILSPALLARLVGLAGGMLFPFSFVLGVVGALIEYVAWTIGFGAMALTRFDRSMGKSYSEL